MRLVVHVNLFKLIVNRIHEKLKLKSINPGNLATCVCWPWCAEVSKESMQKKSKESSNLNEKLTVQCTCRVIIFLNSGAKKGP